MENEETPHIRKNIDGSLEFYETTSYSLTLNIFLFLSSISVFITLFSMRNVDIVTIILYLLITFLLLSPFMFIMIHLYKKSKRPFITLLPFRIRVRNKDYLWQDISEIYYYTLKTSYLVFYFLKETKIEKFKIGNLSEDERKILLEKIKEYKNVIEDTPPALTQLGFKIMKKIGKEKWLFYKRILTLIFIILFPILFFIIQIKSKN